MSESQSKGYWYLRKTAGKACLHLIGDWRLKSYNSLLASLPQDAPLASEKIYQIDGQNLKSIDTASALLLLRVSGALESGRLPDLINFNEHHLSVIELVYSRATIENYHLNESELNQIQKIGKRSLAILKDFKNTLAFIGESSVALLKSLANPTLIRRKELFVQLEQVCVDAIPIVCLVMALLGVVITYLFSVQLAKYGATIFVADAVTLAMCRELSPVIVAITLAGRSGSAYTAQIGAMKMNQEIDAMRIIGLSPIKVLVIPRVLALIVALPILTFIGNLVSVTAGMICADLYIDLSSISFINRVQSNFPYKSFWLGLLKTPVFALVVAVIGCKMGLNVESNARSLGQSTTSTVVQSIVLVIIIDALFAAAFAKFGYY
jgi:phospholipid/cholesterol/gamma-HCH transport system permease protein